jgi:hypothetical protein
MKETPQQYTKRIRGYMAGKKAVDVLSATPKQIARLIRGVSKKKLSRRPVPNAWSTTEILAHLADAEIVQSYRLRLILGSNRTPIQSYDQNVWAKFSEYHDHDPVFSLESYRINRERNLRLLRSLPRRMWSRYGIHAERGRETVSRIVEMMAGHDINHVNQIRRILQ